jgi:hypothetical protein
MRRPGPWLLLDEPFASLRVERIDFLAGQSGHVGFHFVADVLLEVAEMAIAFRKSKQLVAIQLKERGRVDGIDTIFLIDRLSPDYAPLA